MPTLALPLWAMILLIGMPCVTVLTIIASWIYVLRMMATYHQETSKMLTDGHAIAQAIAAQTRELLRRTEP